MKKGTFEIVDSLQNHTRHVAATSLPHIMYRQCPAKSVQANIFLISILGITSYLFRLVSFGSIDDEHHNI